MAKMTTCKTCGSEIASRAKVCPSCGAKNKKPIYKKVWFWIVVVIIVAGVAGGGESTTTSTDTNSEGSKTVETSTNKKEKFELVEEPTMESDQFATYIKGIIKNNSGKDCTYVQVTFNLYDAEGNQVGTALANINNLEKDGTWKFKALGTDVDKQVESFKLAEITGY